MSDSKETKALHFVQKMLEQSSEDKGLRATLRLAANPNTESRAWPVLIRWGVDVSGPEKDAYCLVMALAARYTGRTDGTLSLGGHCVSVLQATTRAPVRRPGFSGFLLVIRCRKLSLFCDRC